jgi:polyhydroxyalkanoate synthesis repressor PhaR
LPATASSSADTAIRVIKKYPNRRLYDTQASAYITLSEIRQLVMKSEPLVVRDAKTGDDLTRSILLQIILEEEAAGMPMFSEALLANLIRFYGHALQGYMGPFLEQQLQILADWQARLGEQAKPLTPEAWGQFTQQWSNPFMGGLLQPSSQVMEKMQEQMQKNTEQMLGVLGLHKS